MAPGQTNEAAAGNCKKAGALAGGWRLREALNTNEKAPEDSQAPACRECPLPGGAAPRQGGLPAPRVSTATPPVPGIHRLCRSVQGGFS